jgi:hypothetical protein
MSRLRRFGACIAFLALATACKGSSEPDPPGPPAEVRAVSNAPGPIPIASPAPVLTARVVDARGKGVPNVVVVWSADDGMLSPTQTVTDEKGDVQTTWSSGTRVGSRTITATASTTGGPRSASFAVTVLAPRALAFDGSDDYVQVPASTSLYGATRDFTWEIWLRPSRTGTRGDVMTKKDVFADPEHDVALVHEESGRVSAFLRERTFGPTVVITSGGSIGTEWTHVAMARSADSVRLYVNGELQGTRFAPFDVVSNGPLRIGANRLNNAGPDAAPVFPFAGLVHEVRIWSVARTEAQIAAAARGCVARQSAGLVADYRFDEGTGTTIRDASGAGNNGTLRNGLGWVAGAARCT